MLKTLTKIKLPKLLVDFGSLMSSELIMIIAQILIGVLVARILGPAGKGVVTTAMVIPTLVLSFAELGLSSTMIYLMGKKKYDDQSLISTLSLLIFFTSSLGIIATFIAYLITGFHVRYGWLVILIPLGIIPARLVIAYINGILMGKGRITRVAIANLLPDAIYFICIIAILLFGVLRVELVLFSQVMSVIISAGYFISIIRGYGHLKPVYYSELLWSMLKKGVMYALTSFIIGLNFSLDVVILEHLTNSTEVGIYSVGTSLAGILLWLPSVFNQVNFSYSANSTDSLAYAKKTAVILRVVLCVAIIPVFLLFILSPYVVPLVYGNAYITSSFVVQAILPGVWALLILKILYGDLAGRGRPEAALYVFSFSVIINIALNIWWDPLFGAIGSAWASTVSYTIGGVIFGIVYAKLSKLTLRELFIIQKEDIKPLLSMFKKS